MKLWSLKIPSKININLWRITNNYLPTFSNLKLRKLRAIALCPICGEKEVMVAHLFWDCSFIRKVFQGVGLVVPPVHANQEWTQWLANIFNTNSISHCSMLAITMWALWYNRIKMYPEGIQYEFSRSSISTNDFSRCNISRGTTLETLKWQTSQNNFWYLLPKLD